MTQEFEVAKPEGEDLNCSFQVVESIPEGLVYNESSEWTSLSTFKVHYGPPMMSQGETPLKDPQGGFRGV